MPRLNPYALTFGTFTSSYPPVAQVIQSAQALEAAGFDHVWSGDQLQFQHPHRLWTSEHCDGARANPKLAAKFALQPLMSVLGQHTRRVCIGQGVLDPARTGDPRAGVPHHAALHAGASDLRPRGRRVEEHRSLRLRPSPKDLDRFVADVVSRGVCKLEQ